MGKLVLAIDLDGTVMHSRRSWSPGDICVERINGVDQGFMRGEAYRALCDICEKAHIVPITSRSVEQFRRIEWGEIKVDLAYVANGGIRINPGGGNPERLFDCCQYSAVLEEARGACLRDACVERCQIIDGCYVIAYLHDPKANVSDFQRFCGGTLTMFRDRRKLYFFPIDLNKGLAIDDIRIRLPGVRVVAAGDSTNDMPMLERADKALVPMNLIRSLRPKREVPAFETCPEDGPFEAFVGSSIADEANSHPVN